MLEASESHARNLFEIENARNLNREEMVETFVPTQSFWRLLSAKNHIILGSRGSGKTALARMLSHDHLAKLEDPRAKSAVQGQDFIGMYVPTHLEWVGGLKNKRWQSELEKELFFQWRLNLATCISFLATIQSCVRTYVQGKGQQARVEREIATKLSESWANAGIVCDTFQALRYYLEDLEYSMHQEIAALRVRGESAATSQIGLPLGADLFIPLRRGITVASRVLKMKDGCAWLLCLDEAEFLEEIHHRILNSHMRAYPGNLFFKMTTMPYCHYTLATNAGVSLDVGHDFEYVYIDADPVLFDRMPGEKGPFGTRFARTIFRKRAEATRLKYADPENLLGRSEILDEKEEDWSPGSDNMRRLGQLATPETIQRAQRLLGKPSFKPQISRKIRGALLLKEEIGKLKGNYQPEAYSGATMAIRCGDANPRRLITIYNAMLLKIWDKIREGVTLPTVPPKLQTAVLRKLSASILDRVISEPSCGPELHKLLNTVGTYMGWALRNRKLSTDQVSSIIVEHDVTMEVWTLIQRSVELGLLYPSLSSTSPDDMPYRRGIFHLAFVLAPHFFILPRRGEARKLSSILAEMASLPPNLASEYQNGEEQPSLFNTEETDEGL